MKINKKAGNHKTGYDAFISYKHEKRDAEIAAVIQRDLEHFHVPEAIRKKTKKKSIGPVFRDKDELSLTDDLSEEIRHALSVSEFLIVVCSSRTRDSIWVDREITFFLKEHDAKHILTVIAEGEPPDVLPQRLLDEEKEPLSADYRISKREAKRKELPRIAASLLGCGYDDLIHRSQQYRMRRITAFTVTIAAAGTAASLYFLWSRDQIAKSLQKAQRSQVQYFSGEVESLLEEDLDVSAAQLAVHTVPEDRTQTPAQSWRVLADAGGAYIPPETSNLFLNTRVTGELHSSDAIRFVKESADQTKICTVDITNHIHVWDAKKHKDLLAFQEKDKVLDVILAKKSLVVGTEEYLYGYDLKQGKRTWSVKRGMSGEKWNTSSYLQTDKSGAKVIALNAVKNQDQIQNFLSVIDPDKGKRILDIPLKTDDSWLLSPENLVVSDDGKYASFFASSPDAEFSMNGIWIASLDKGTLLKSEISLYSGGNLDFLSNDNLIAQGSPDKESFNSSGLSNGTIGYFHTIGNTVRKVYSILPESGKKLWDSDIQYNLFNKTRMYADSFSNQEKDGKKRNLVYATAANVLQIYDAETGEQVNRYELPDCIADIGIVDSKDDSNAVLRAVCCGGTVNRIDPGEKDVTYIELFSKDTVDAFSYSVSDQKEGTKEAEQRNGYFILPEGSDTLLQYDMNASDPDFRAISKETEKGPVLYFSMTDHDYAAVFGTENYKDEPVLKIYDRESKKYLRSFHIPHCEQNQKHFIGVTEGGKELIYFGKDKDSANLYKISLKNGTSRKLNLDVGDFFLSKGRRILLVKNRLYYIGEEGWLCSYDIANGKKQSFPAFSKKELQKTSYSSKDVCAFSISPDGRYAFAGLEDGPSRIFDLEQEKTAADIATEQALYSEDGNFWGSVDWDRKDRYLAVTGEREVYLLDLTGTILKRIPYEGTQAAGVHFYQDMLLIVYADGSLKRYSIPDGKFSGRTEVFTSIAGSTSEGCLWTDRDDGTMDVHIGSSDSVIDTKEWISMYTVPYSLANDFQNHIFVVDSGNESIGYTLGYFPEYTLDDLIEKCRRAGNYKDLNEETKAKYGLN